jgi:hypothetical protein
MKRWILVGVAVLALAVLAFLGWRHLRPHPAAVPSPRAERVAFVTGFGASWYDIRDGIATSSAVLAANPAILETASTTDGPVALASGGKRGGTILGTLAADGTFAATLDDGTIKSSLVAGRDGVLAYAALLPAPPLAVSAASGTPRVWKEGDPVPPPLSFTSFGGRVPTIQILSPGAAPRTVAPGRPFGALQDGDLLVLTQTGVALLSVADASTTPLIPSTGDIRLAAAYSPAGDTVAYLNPASGAVDVYHIDEGNKRAIYAFSVRATAPVDALAFLDPTRLVMRTASSTLETVGMPATPSGPAPHFPVIKIGGQEAGSSGETTAPPANSIPIEDIVPD